LQEWNSRSSLCTSFDMLLMADMQPTLQKTEVDTVFAQSSHFNVAVGRSGWGTKNIWYDS